MKQYDEYPPALFAEPVPLADWLRAELARDRPQMPLHAAALTGMYAPALFGPANRQPHVRRAAADAATPRAWRRRQRRAGARVT